MLKSIDRVLLPQEKWVKNNGGEAIVDLVLSVLGNDCFSFHAKCLNQKSEENFLTNKFYSTCVVNFVFEFWVFTMTKRSSYAAKFKLIVISPAEKKKK